MQRAWHAGRGIWAGESDMNDVSIGIEIANSGYRGGSPAYPSAQIETVIALCQDIIARWRIRPEELARLRKMQLDLLKQAATSLKPGGLVVYSTCSLEPEENTGVVDEFLQSQTHFKLERARELIPFNDSVDGAFVARLRRT